MASKFIRAVDEKLLSLNPQIKWLKDNLHYEVIMGSVAYGVSQDISDVDIYGWCIPPKSWVFPHLQGYINDFGPAPNKFENFQHHHVKDDNRGCEYDFAIYSVVKYLALIAENNPNMIDSLFVPQNCITHMTAAGSILRDSRKEFLHKGAFHKFKGYAYSQIHKVKTKQVHDNTSSKRRESIEKYGFDVKFSYHCVRLLDECEQILVHGDIDLQRNREQLKAIRRGDMTLDEIVAWFENKEKQLEELYVKSKLPERPDWSKLNTVLLNILEHHYGTISEAVRNDRTAQLVNELEMVLTRYKSQ